MGNCPTPIADRALKAVQGSRAMVRATVRWFLSSSAKRRGKNRCRHPEAQRDSSAEGELRLIPEEWSLGDSVTTWNRD